MKLIVCLDDRGGLSFNDRRQSRDRALIADLLCTVQGEPLYLTPYSLPLFEDYPDAAKQLRVTDTPLASVPHGAYCFWELSVPPTDGRVSEWIVYRWNRHYPADRTLSLPTDGYELVECYDFAGSSHERITKERHIKRIKEYTDR